MISIQSTGKFIPQICLLLLFFPSLTASVQPLAQPKIHTLALGSAIRFWCTATESSIWYSEAGPAAGKYAPGGYNVAIWSNAIHSPQDGQKIADCGYSPAQPLLDSKRKILWFSRRTADTNGDRLIDQRDGLVLIRFDLANNSFKAVTKTDTIAWPLAIDPPSGRILAVVGAYYAILSPKNGKTVEWLAPFLSQHAKNTQPFFDIQGRPWLLRKQGPPLSITSKNLKPGHPVILSCPKSKLSIQIVVSGTLLAFRLTQPSRQALLVPISNALWPLSIVDKSRIIWFDRNQVFAANHLHRQHELILRLPANLAAIYMNPVEPGSLAWLQGNTSGYFSLGAAHWGQEKPSALN